MEPVTGEATRLLAEMRAGNGNAADKLLPLVYRDLRALAQRHLCRERSDHTLQATALVHEAYLRLISAPDLTPRDRVHFFALAAQAMRRILVDHARAHGRAKRGGGRGKRALQDIDEPALVVDPDLVALDEALERLQNSNGRLARIVELHFFGGLSFAEIAELLEISVSTVGREWRVARAWLYRELASDEES
ncbi:MAG: ECF-type sigma factor [Planctomycetota bacterium]|jgi:RNA polymerase sigma factor (TIGR02999 family)